MITAQFLHINFRELESSIASIARRLLVWSRFWSVVAIFAACGCGGESNRNEKNESTSREGAAAERRDRADRPPGKAIDARRDDTARAHIESKDIPDKTDKSRSVDSKPDSSIRFREGASEAGIHFTHQSGNSAEKYFPTSNGSGIAIFDYDGDGLVDLYFCSTRNLPLEAPTTACGNKLYRNRGDGTFDDVTELAGVGFRGFNHGVAAGDVDGDGFIDLFLANMGADVLYMNNGDGTFRDAGAASGVADTLWSSAAAFLDYDMDGNLDLYVSRYGKWSIDGDNPYCGDKQKGIRVYCSQQTIRPERNALYRNRGDGVFIESSEAAKIARSDGRGLGVVTADFDGDGAIDVFAANDQCPNFLFINKKDGTFDDAGELAGAARAESGEVMAGMGVDAEDVNGDGRPELFVTNFREEPNTLYLNVDGKTFQDIGAWAGIARDSLPDVGWGCGLVDFDGDGYPDMIACNGHIDDNLALLGQDVPQAELSKIWRNTGEGKFRLVAGAGDFFDRPHVARGASFGDLDDDGRIDVVIGLMDARPALLWNESKSGGWIRLDLIGRKSNRDAIGARVEVRAGGRSIWRQVKGGGSYLASNDRRLTIGLGSNETVEEVRIDWPSGARSSVRGMKSGESRIVREIDADRFNSMIKEKSGDSTKHAEGIKE